MEYFQCQVHGQQEEPACAQCLSDAFKKMRGYILETETIKTKLKETEAKNKKLVEYTTHRRACEIDYQPSTGCTCGLDELLKELKGEG